MKRRYLKPKLIIRKIRLNLFYRNSRSQFNNVGGVLLAGCTCPDGLKSGGSCGCWN